MRTFPTITNNLLTNVCIQYILRAMDTNERYDHERPTTMKNRNAREFYLTITAIFLGGYAIFGTIALAVWRNVCR